MRLRNLPCGSFPVLLSRQHLRRNTRYPYSRKPPRSFLSDRLPKRGLVVMRQSVPPLRSVGRYGRWRGLECWFLRKGCERGGEKPEREFVIRILLRQIYAYISVSAHYSNLQRIRHDGRDEKQSASRDTLTTTKNANLFLRILHRTKDDNKKP